MKTVRELNRDQLVELKQNYLTRLDEEGTLNEVLYNDPDDESGLSQGELANADNLVPDDVVFNEYEGTMFHNDDFFCTAGQDE
jgi:hypothetical protein